MLVFFLLFGATITDKHSHPLHTQPYTHTYTHTYAHVASVAALMNIPQLLLDIAFDAIPVVVSDTQFRDVMALKQAFALMEQEVLRRRSVFER